MPYNVRDALLKQTVALPSSAGTAVITAFDLGEVSASPAADFVAKCELLISAPALNTTQLPDTTTVTYSIEQSTDNFATNTVVLADKVLVQTGASSAGAAANTARYRPPENVSRYLRVKATTGANSGDCSAKSLTAELLF
jgi:hypothetical protein